RRLDADEDHGEAGFDALGHQLRIAREIDRNLRREPHAAVRTRVVPFDQPCQQFARPSSHHREVVIGEQHAAVTLAVERVEFSDALVRRLPALLATQVLDDVAELALERAAAGCLHLPGDREATRVKIPAWHRAAGETWPAPLVMGLPLIRSD